MKAAQAVPLDDKFVITFDRAAYSVPEWAKACGRGETVVYKHIEAGNLVPQYPDSKAMITLEEGLRWLRSLPDEPPARATAA
jgi:hypothetical protein